jgi:GDP-4-dehydro-6-deoxy-D-mannose reductase
MVTGADGFVGPHLVAELAGAGHEVEGRAGPGSAPAPLDVLDAGALRAALEVFAPDAVVNLAGVSSVAHSHRAPAETFRVNALGVVELCAALRDAAPRARLLMIGSGEMYGALPPGARASESTPLAPSSPYAAAKAAGEVAALAWKRAYGLDVVAARPFAQLGRGQRPSFALPGFARQLEAMRKTGGVLAVGNLEVVRDYSHVGDVVAAYRVLLERGVAGEAYNVCSGVGRTLREVLDELVTRSGVAARVEVDPARLRPADLPCSVGDPAKLVALGWAPRRTLGEALADVVLEAREAAELDLVGGRPP